VGVVGPVGTARGGVVTWFQTVMCAIGVFCAGFGITIWAIILWSAAREKLWERRLVRRGEALFDETFARQAGIDLSRTARPTFLGPRS
jgi:hypothetical protein